MAGLNLTVERAYNTKLPSDDEANFAETAVQIAMHSSIKMHLPGCTRYIF